MAAKKKSRGKQAAHTQVVVRLKGYKATKKELEHLRLLGEELGLQFLTKIGTPVKQVAVAAKTIKGFSRSHHEVAPWNSAKDATAEG